ncbi:MAG: EscN/YscN/HrcN family type III secretion system ATPase, partial [Sinomonas sp.]|nr:EscN/YscN/HrcN family type III secretion system ATPase [Sinomonas sp.]
MRGLAAALGAAAPERVGVVTGVLGLGFEVAGLACALGDLVAVTADDGAVTEAEVVASARGALTCMPLGRLAGFRAGNAARRGRGGLGVPTGAGLFGRVLDGLGRPIDGRG